MGIKKLNGRIFFKLAHMLLTLCMLGNFSCFCCGVLTFFKMSFFKKKKKLSGTLLECQKVWIQIRTDVLSVRIWVQTVCKDYQQTTKVAAIKKELYFMMLYPSVNFKWNCCIPSKVTDRKPKFSQKLSKKGHNSVKILQMISKFKLDLYFIMFYPSVNFDWNWCIPSKVIDREPKVWCHRRRSHDL